MNQRYIRVSEGIAGRREEETYVCVGLDSYWLVSAAEINSTLLTSKASFCPFQNAY